METLLEIQSLSIGYPPKNAIQKNINADLYGGQIISLVGQNGVGKSTFLRTVAGLQPKIEGNIKINGKSIQDMSLSDLAHYRSITLTEKPGNLHLTVAELVSFGRYPHTRWFGLHSNADREKIKEVLEICQITYIENKLLSELSDGQLQKAMIAKALAQETSLIIMDEPLAHLDIHNKIEIIALLKRIASEGKGILISTHDTQLALQFSDFLWLFNFNAEIIKGIPEEVAFNGSLHSSLFLEPSEYDFFTGVIRLETNVKTEQKIHLVGSGILFQWTERLLLRKGFHLDRSAKRKIEVGKDAWRLDENYIDSWSHLVKQLTNSF